MKTELDHLPEKQQHELARVRDILLEEFGKAIANATQPWKKNGKVLKIVLFGSYARDDWVDEPENGYQSDLDLLIVVSHEDLTDIADYWYVAEDRIARDPTIARPVNIIVHSLHEVNTALKRGEYFWTDIARDGVAVYELPCHPLATPMPLTAADAYRMAQEYFDYWLPLADHARSLSDTSVQNGVLRDAAFMLHQAAERLYICFLLVRTLYFPRSHNIKFLRSLAEDKDPRLVEAWPRETRIDRSRFERLKRAYVEARYSASYEITVQDLQALAASIAQLRGIVATLSEERLAELQAQAGE
ncbi:nucleotidyltransferase and HEPN domain-containing protein [Sphingomonas sp. NIBR02145]|uniref:nucleotidyltransferase and HEPN domain-containing protein n=1 Tax=Sphingomonas sp. NIBR02145 TaxID=3014784 RepID=UPI0022B3AB87|nr:nucleotidyltransferase and HEPN domain-containing protein [Sphingomonas sp. NIBR02145]WHU05018.1 nucleotidyltransferase and HEPN domain-containing protein [Sphingomonas sp. NIBR02145]